MPRSRIGTKNAAKIAATAVTSLRLFCPPANGVDSPDHAWYDFDGDRHHVVVIPLGRRDEALALAGGNPRWTVQRCPNWYLCVRRVVGGSDATT